MAVSSWKLEAPLEWCDKRYTVTVRQSKLNWLIPAAGVC